MQLSDSSAGDVLRNLSNSSFYRFERPERDKVRIRPLELFPNGLLIAKSTDTLVNSDLVVELIGTWSDGMVVTGVRGRSRATYEKELEQCTLQLEVLEAEILVAHERPGGLGSHMNRVKASRNRIRALKAGLEDLQIEPIQIDMGQMTAPPFKLKQVVVMPSGLPALFLGLLPQQGHLLATVATRALGSKQMLTLQIDPAALRPSSIRHMATI